MLLQVKPNWFRGQPYKKKNPCHYQAMQLLLLRDVVMPSSSVRIAEAHPDLTSAATEGGSLEDNKLLQ